MIRPFIPDFHFIALQGTLVKFIASRSHQEDCNDCIKLGQTKP